MGGFRVGVVKEMTPEVAMVNGERRSDRGRRPEARQEGRAARDATPSCACGRARRSASSTSSSSRARARTTFTSGDTIPVQNASEPLEFEDLFSTFDPRDAAAHPERDRRLRRRLRGPRPVDQPLDRGAQPVLPRADAGDDEPGGPGHRARPVLPPDRARLRAGRAGGAHAGAPVHGHGRHVRGDLGEPAGAPGHDREGRADDGRVDRLVPRPAAVPRGLHRPLGPAAARRRRAAALAAGDQQPPSRSARRCCRGRSS